MAVEIRRDQEDAVLRVAAYHRLDYDLVVIQSPPHELDAMRGSLFEPFLTPPTTPLGDLGAIPVEILSAICLEMDVTTLFHFRQVNRLARNVVSALPPYKDIIKHALEAFRASLRTRIGIHFTLTDMHAALCTPHRCCWDCLRLRRSATLGDLANYYGTSQADLRQLLPVVHAVPGVYTMRQVRRTGGQKLVSMQAIDVLVKRGVLARNPRLDDSFRSHFSPWTFEEHAPAMVSTAFPYLDRATGEPKVHHGFMCKACHIAFEIEFYDYDPETFPGVDCTYTKQGFLEHFPYCEYAVKLWNASQGGTVEFDEPEFTKTGGNLKFVDDQENPR